MGGRRLSHHPVVLYVTPGGVARQRQRELVVLVGVRRGGPVGVELRAELLAVPERVVHPQAQPSTPPHHSTISLPSTPTTHPAHLNTHTMDDFFNPPSTDAEPSVEDFLAREAAALGADAHSFGTPGASADKDFEASASAFPDLDGEGDFVSAPGGLTGSVTGAQFGGQEGGQVSVTNDNQFSAFEEEYPAVEVEGQSGSQVS